MLSDVTETSYHHHLSFCFCLDKNLEIKYMFFISRVDLLF